MLQESLANDENTLFMRQIKEDMRGFDGKPLFLPRHVTTPAYKLSDPERKLYRNVTRVRAEPVQHGAGRRTRRGTSDSRSWCCSAGWRPAATPCTSPSGAGTKGCQRLLSDFEGAERPATVEFSFEEEDSMSEEERWKREGEWETLSIAKNRDELKREIRTLEELSVAAKGVIDGEHEVKMQELKRTMELFGKEHRDDKILVFTEAKDTLLYLGGRGRIRSWGYEVSTIHGGMKLEERILAEKEFQNTTQVMVATEGPPARGINLQFCHLMINYDIPWNPNRLEQRMGRIHRYGQRREVFVYNLIAQDTIEGKIFRSLFEKLGEIREKMGTDQVYDIIGNIDFGKDLAQMLVDAATGARTEEDILRDIEITIDDDYIQKIREDLTDTLATKNIDFSQLDDIREQGPQGEQAHAGVYSGLFRQGICQGGGAALGVVRGARMRLIRFRLRYAKYPRKTDSEIRSAPTLGRYPKITFSKEMGRSYQDAEFLTFGHPLFEATLEWASRRFAGDLQRGAAFVDSSGRLDGTILFYEGSVNDGTGRAAGKRLFSYYVDARTGEAEDVPPSIMWDLDVSVIDGIAGGVDLDAQKQAARGKVIRALREYQREILEERERQARIKKKYGIRSLEKLIHDHDAALMGLRERQRNGEDVNIAIHNKEEKQKQYIESKKSLADLIERERNLTINTPKMLGAVRVTVPDVITDIMRENAESERIAMDVAMAFERKHGREPIDVSREMGRGYDIKSTGRSETRYIEVKGRRGEGSVALTRNEWFKARHLRKDYYLYVVWNAVDAPNANLLPMVIADPAHTTDPKFDIHYIVGTKDIRSKSA